MSASWSRTSLFVQIPRVSGLHPLSMLLRDDMQMASWQYAR
ncbi:hypothetical protein CfE428DRAFT_1266 [Chthoniobacter flavus Ellin428]|uniref:Uncharacterized protein n=1 Tax=Chthoniobacter flavus Ellin428 TaxID=497964 RepID=B4CXH5_9BACT|nr:hypothetical protein CfE428DRAFT_1266 [Chthoniobacter flavus Ellin428]TCO88701.1 hypothetical protein EV701_11673 [Chthoniobacter flavus]